MGERPLSSLGGIKLLKERRSIAIHAPAFWRSGSLAFWLKMNLNLGTNIGPVIQPLGIIHTEIDAAV